MKQKQNKDMILKLSSKLVLNKLKIMEIFTFIYTHQTSYSNKFLKKLSTYMWFMCTHV
jgi:hypothetical protein